MLSTTGQPKPSAALAACSKRANSAFSFSSQAAASSSASGQSLMLRWLVWMKMKSGAKAFSAPSSNTRFSKNRE